MSLKHQAKLSLMKLKKKNNGHSKAFMGAKKMLEKSILQAGRVLHSSLLIVR